MELVQAKNDISVNDLIKANLASPATIRRDIKELTKAGLITRSHGYIHKKENNNPIPPLKRRSNMAYAEKVRIADYCKELIHPGMTVILDSGSTCAAIASSIQDMDITIVTNSIEICTILQPTNAKVICTGGIMENKDICFLGRDANNFIKNLEVDIGFIGATGIRLNNGFTTSSPLFFWFCSPSSKGSF